MRFCTRLMVDYLILSVLNEALYSFDGRLLDFIGTKSGSETVWW
jgi:hypothetical protein